MTYPWLPEGRNYLTEAELLELIKRLEEQAVDPDPQDQS